MFYESRIFVYDAGHFIRNYRNFIKQKEEKKDRYANIHEEKQNSQIICFFK